MRYSYEFGKTLTEHSKPETIEEHFLLLYGLRQAMSQTRSVATMDTLRVLEDDTRISLLRLKRGYEPLSFKNQDAGIIDEIVLSVAQPGSPNPNEVEQHWQAVAKYVIANAVSEVVSQTISLPQQRIYE